MLMNIQFKKGVLELCVLSLLTKREFYGYELVEYISEYINISEGTIYPLLRRFRKEGYVTTYLQESQEGPPRKYYRITEEGLSAYEELLKEWEEFTIGVNNIIRGDFVE
ncbi:PadR family transcriptional regulator, regulatory protein PadR [Tepidimicrobium xylanilyticum]|uniref:PadR family transcriptional regulator, regulatory protein PadR n=2 Tax=Tepidimicrobium xylanilyticum TaxID=1123352 RepID=A0A1H2Z782_9FIRM|nr:PadR family transcriptional regulator, regulatory protein PadR [Tepidimicrobium xylanilyticum]